MNRESLIYWGGSLVVGVILAVVFGVLGHNDASNATAYYLAMGACIVVAALSLIVLIVVAVRNR